MKEKRYPFSIQKHAHDIEFRRNFVFNRMTDADEGVIDKQLFNSLYQTHQRLTALLLAVMNSSRDGRIAWLTGPQIGLAKETVAWANNCRADRMA